MTYVIMTIVALLSYSRLQPAEVPVRIDHTVKGAKEGRFKRRWPTK